jgi:Domain of unknown function (DUF4333)
MTANRFWSVRPAMALAAAALLVAGCGGSDSDDGGSDEPEGPETVERSELESQVSSGLEEEIGQAPDAVDCPDELLAEVDATTRCTLTAGTDEVGLTVTVSSVEDGDVAFDIKVDDEVQ